MRNFSNRLILWYKQAHRALPWRNTTDPYKIWLSEVIMQQTRVQQGLAYYLKFEKRFPDLVSLAEASEDEVYKLWQGLGYYNRAQNLMHAARTLVKNYNGKFPRDPEELIKIKGIGSYTAAAVASIAFGKRIPVVDGNVFRVLSRAFGITTPVHTAKAKNEFASLAGKLMAHHPPGTFNQALMEFGALWCKPKNPDCGNCIFFKDCFARINGQVQHLPVKKVKTPVKNRFFYYVVAEDHNEKILLQKRGKKDIWRNLYEFPVIEPALKSEPLKMLAQPPVRKLFSGLKYVVKDISEEYVHLLTHQRIHAVFMHIFVENFPEMPDEKTLFLVHKNDIEKYPVPRLLERYLLEHKLI